MIKRNYKLAKCWGFIRYSPWILFVLLLTFCCSAHEAINSKPTPSFTYTPTSPVAGQAVQFSDTSTGDPTSWRWDFGDGTTSTAQNPSHTFTTVSSYNVTLTVSNSSGTSSASRTINILPTSALTASFTYSPSSPAVGQAVQFTDTSTGSPTSWQWEFGDGAFSTAENPSHAYAVAGPYIATLTIGAGSNSNGTSRTIAVRQPGIVTAASPALADVSLAISNASPGDTVIVPEGTATWNNQLAITKGIKLIGAGIGNTVITSNYAGGGGIDKANFLVAYEPSNPAANEPFRLSGFEFNVSGKSGWLRIKNTTVGTINSIRIDNNKVYNTAGLMLFVYGTACGVMDSNNLQGWGFRFLGMDAKAWNSLTFIYGTANNWYIEDNTINLTSSAEYAGYAEGGCWYCFRHNTISSANAMYPMFDAHGNQPSAHHATMGIEIYENTINSGSYSLDLVDQRGGRALVFNNTINTSGDVWTIVREEYNDALNPPPTSSDGQPQHVADAYYWNNLRNGTTRFNAFVEETVNYGGSIGLVPQENREFWNQQTPFNGTAGMGVGLESARPATCTVGVGYWATDKSILYRCKATNVWTQYYVPYPYPHPLRSLLSN